MFLRTPWSGGFSFVRKAHDLLMYILHDRTRFLPDKSLRLSDRKGLTGYGRLNHSHYSPHITSTINPFSFINLCFTDSATRSESGRGSGRINPEYHRRLSHSVQSVGLTIPRSQPCSPRSVPFVFSRWLWLTRLTVQKMKRSGLLRFWGDGALSLRVGLGYFCIFLLKVSWLFPRFSLSYLHLISKRSTIGDNKSLSPPNQSLDAATREGNKF